MASSNPGQNLPFNLHAESVENLTDGLTCQWVFNHHALVFVAQHSERLLVDIWLAKVVAEVDRLPEGMPFFVMNDFSAKNCVSTAYARERIRELIGRNAQRKTAIAMVVQDNFSMQLSRLFVRAIRIPNYQVNLSFKYADGMTWLYKQVEAYKQSTTQV